MTNPPQSNMPKQDSLDEILATLQHRTYFYMIDNSHDYKWTLRTPNDGDEGLLCVCGFHVRREWLDEAEGAIESLYIQRDKVVGAIKEDESMGGKYHMWYCSSDRNPEQNGCICPSTIRNQLRQQIRQKLGLSQDGETKR